MLKDLSVHWFYSQMISGIFGGPAFSLYTAKVQNGDIWFTIGLYISPSISYACILLDKFTIFSKIWVLSKSLEFL